MAKLRFPGKALKLNSRKRVKFRFGNDTNLDEYRIVQIKSGLLLFNELFGESEEDEDDFLGFGEALETTVFRKKKKKKLNIEPAYVQLKAEPSHASDLNNSVEDNDENDDTCLSIIINGLVDNTPNEDTVILENKRDNDEKSLQSEKDNLEKCKDSKKLKENSERTSKIFVLPSVSARSSRIIKPNKLFSDFTLPCSTNQQSEDSKQIISESVIEPAQKALNKVKQVDPDAEDTDPEKESDPVCRSITFYTDSITEEFKGQVGRPPKRLLRRTDTQLKEEQYSPFNNSLSPSKGPKEEKVKEKIEKLLRSPWDSRIKNSKAVGKEKDRSSLYAPLNNANISKSILRKARLNLNKQTLQKIRSPASVQRLVPLSEDETAENKCGLCQSISCNTICRYGVSCCDTCHLSINFFTENLTTILDCVGGQGECQLVGLSVEERCLACWLSRILVTCAMPSLLHDRLRNCLSSTLREKIPTSLGRSCIGNSVSPEDLTGDGKGFSGDSSRNFGLLVDLPGGWKRKNGNEVIVISPSGEKFRSVTKLEEYLKRQGINAQASVLFGNLSSKGSSNLETKLSIKQAVKPSNKVNNVVVTTLPGGWTRRIKWKNTGDKFDTYVCSPDGRTFRSRKELSSYFQHIGKIDDIYKYFPVKSSTASCVNSSENSEASSTEPISSSDEKSPHVSDSEGEEIVPDIKHLDKSETQKPLGADQPLEEFLERSIGDVSENSLCNDGDGSPSKETISLSKVSEKLIISNFNSHLQVSGGNVSEAVNKDSEDYPVDDDRPPSLELTALSSKDLTLSSLSDSESDDVSGVNLNQFHRKDENLFTNSVKEFCEKPSTDGSESEKLVLKLKKTFQQSSIESGKESSGSKHKKKKKKKKRKHEKEKHKDVHKKKSQIINYPLVCDVDKIATNVADQSSILLSDLSAKSSCQSDLKYSFFSDVNSDVFCHPNDTWQTLISYSIPDPVKSKSDISSSKRETEILEEPIDIEFKKPDVKKLKFVRKSIGQNIKKIQKLSGFTTQHFGNGWGRKIKWNEKGQGKVSFLTSPDGQKIVSSIELMAYFKKAGKAMFNIDHYFPKDLVRELPKEEEEEESVNEVANEDLMLRLSPTPSYKEKLEQKRKERNTLNHPITKYGKRTLKLLKKGSVQKVKLKSRLLNKDLENNTDNSSEIFVNGEEANTGSDAGPRVKHVCRSQAQVLGMPRAVFPSPDKKQSQTSSLKRKVVYTGKMTTKFLSVLTPKGKRVLKKTVWCNKCAGCTTPNCRVCGNCLDMKKYGGPGTKKKPCVMRKCHNPTRAVKCVTYTNSNSDPPEEPTYDQIEKENKQSGENASSKSVAYSRSASSIDPNSELEIMSDVPLDYSEGRQNEDQVYTSVERPIFIPKMMKPFSEPKDKGDIQAGKECIPGTRVNIDYWQEYDAEEMLISGFPIITSVPLQTDSFCFRCGSAGVEQLLYCIWCCEGVHPFCLEEGEGPENEEEETFWVCRKCAVCHVCGGSGHYDLLQCSGCRMHYHIECLGPTSHISCQPLQEGIWVSDALHLLPLSWPKQTPIIDVSDEYVIDSNEETVTLLEELENFRSFNELLEEGELSYKKETCLFPFAMDDGKLNMPMINLPSSDKKKNIFVESVQIEDTIADLEEEDHICLEDAFEGLDEISSPILPRVDEFVHFYRNVDLLDSNMPHEEEKCFARMEEDEYLCLKYKKIVPFDQSPVESSLLKILHIINSEMYDYFGYSACMKEEQNIGSDCSNSGLSDIKPDSTKLDNTDIDLNSAIQIRRSEVQQAIRNLEDRRIQEEKRIKEIEREKSRKRRLELNKDGGDKVFVKSDRKRLKFVRPNHIVSPISPNEILMDEYFVEYRDNASYTHWQPQSWKEFDAMFLRLNRKNNESTSGNTFDPSGKLIVKRKRGRPRENLLPGQKKAKKLKFSQCSVKVNRIELRKWKTGRKLMSPKKALLKKRLNKPSITVSKIGKPVSNINENSSEDGDQSSNPKMEIKVISSQSIGELLDTVVCEISSNSMGEEKSLYEQEDITIEAVEDNSLIELSHNDLESSPSPEFHINISDKSEIPVPEEDENLSHLIITDSYSLNIKESKEDRPSTRPRRTSYGRASELASLRKAMMDI